MSDSYFNIRLYCWHFKILLTGRPSIIYNNYHENNKTGKRFEIYTWFGKERY